MFYWESDGDNSRNMSFIVVHSESADLTCYADSKKDANEIVKRLDAVGEIRRASDIVNGDEVYGLKGCTGFVERVSFRESRVLGDGVVGVMVRLDDGRELGVRGNEKVILIPSDTCRMCGGSGAVDSGGTTPWMEPIEIECPECGS